MNLYLNLFEIHLSLKSVSLTACVPHKYVNVQSFWVPATVKEFSSFAFIFSPFFVISSADQKMAVIPVRFSFAHSYSCKGVWI